MNALSSKRSKEVWKIIHRVLHPNLKSLRADPNELNKYFISIATRTLGAKPSDMIFRICFAETHNTRRSAS